MLNRLNILVAIAILLILVACSDNAPNLPEYKIHKETNKGNKRSVEVELSSRTNEETLITLAEKIHVSSNMDIQRTFIRYRIAGGDKNEPYWATTHYDPDLEVKIFGATASDYEKIKNTALPKGEVLGAWMASWGRDFKIIAYKQDGHTYIREVYGGGSARDGIYELSQSKEGRKLQDEGGKVHGEYFIINPKGNLEFWSKNGNYYTTYRAIQQSTTEIPVN
tara:strand:- start:17 stop:682 length:666 start_codon:yes stop_codon:yes gene_type:complete